MSSVTDISVTDIEKQVKEMEQSITDMDDVEISIIQFGSNEVASVDIQENKSFQMYDVAWSVHVSKYRGADKSLARPWRKQANVSVRMARISFVALPSGWGGGNSMTARVSM